MTDAPIDILKTATDWAKAEAFSSAFFVALGVLFLLASVGFWQLAKTDMAKAYVVPALVAGVLLSILGVGLLFPNLMRIGSFAEAYASNPDAFVASEIGRVDAVLNQFRIAVFGIFPLVMAVCALWFLFVEAPIWRASLLTVIAMLAVVLLIDTTAHARLEQYRVQLVEAGQPR